MLGPWAPTNNGYYLQNGLIKDIGLSSDERFQQIQSSGISAQDLDHRTVLPGFIDGHMHLLMLGQSLRKLDLWGCEDFDDIRARIKQYVADNPDMPRILCKSWMNFMSDGKALASMLDDLTDKPIFIDSRDLHSVWCNTAGLKDLGVDAMEVPPGGVVERERNL